MSVQRRDAKLNGPWSGDAAAPAKFAKATEATTSLLANMLTVISDDSQMKVIANSTKVSMNVVTMKCEPTCKRV